MDAAFKTPLSFCLVSLLRFRKQYIVICYSSIFISLLCIANKKYVYLTIYHLSHIGLYSLAGFKRVLKRTYTLMLHICWKILHDAQNVLALIIYLHITNRTLRQPLPYESEMRKSTIDRQHGQNTIFQSYRSRSMKYWHIVYVCKKYVRLPAPSSTSCALCISITYNNGFVLHRQFNRISSYYTPKRFIVPTLLDKTIA